MCRDDDGAWVAVEIKRVGTIDAVEQLTRLPRAASGSTRPAPTAAASSPRSRFKPQALTLAESRGIRCVEVDLAVLRGESEPELTLFAV